jgi:hypothetical protein
VAEEAVGHALTGMKARSHSEAPATHAAVELVQHTEANASAMHAAVEAVHCTEDEDAGLVERSNRMDVEGLGGSSGRPPLSTVDVHSGSAVMPAKRSCSNADDAREEQAEVEPCDAARPRKRIRNHASHVASQASASTVRADKRGAVERALCLRSSGTSSRAKAGRPVVSPRRAEDETRTSKRSPTEDPRELRAVGPAACLLPEGTSQLDQSRAQPLPSNVVQSRPSSAGLPSRRSPTPSPGSAAAEFLSGSQSPFGDAVVLGAAPGQSELIERQLCGVQSALVSFVPAPAAAQGVSVAAVKNRTESPSSESVGALARSAAAASGPLLNTHKATGNEPSASRSAAVSPTHAVQGRGAAHSGGRFATQTPSSQSANALSGPLPGEDFGRVVTASAHDDDRCMAEGVHPDGKVSGGDGSTLTASTTTPTMRSKPSGPAAHSQLAEEQCMPSEEATSEVNQRVEGRGSRTNRAVAAAADVGTHRMLVV